MKIVKIFGGGDISPDESKADSKDKGKVDGKTENATENKKAEEDTKNPDVAKKKTEGENKTEGTEEKSEVADESKDEKKDGEPKGEEKQEEKPDEKQGNKPEVENGDTKNPDEKKADEANDVNAQKRAEDEAKEFIKEEKDDFCKDNVCVAYDFFSNVLSEVADDGWAAKEQNERILHPKVQEKGYAIIGDCVSFSYSPDFEISGEKKYVNGMLIACKRKDREIADSKNVKAGGFDFSGEIDKLRNDEDCMEKIRDYEVDGYKCFDGVGTGATEARAREAAEERAASNAFHGLVINDARKASLNGKIACEMIGQLVSGDFADLRVSCFKYRK